MKVAVIDIGTNTFNLLIASKSNRRLSLDLVLKEFVFLGQGGINKNIIQREALLRGLGAMKKFKEIADKHGVKKIIAVATSAVRNAQNGNDFVGMVKSLTGIEVTVINGNTEADYIYKGAREATNFGEQPALLMDVGGGSTEFIICDKYGTHWKKSIEVGASRLFEKFHNSDPITTEEIHAIHEHLESEISLVIQKAEEFEVETLIGSSGSFTSFAKIVANRIEEAEKLVKTSDYDFDIAAFYELNEEILASTLEERFSIPGLIKERAPMLVVGTVLVCFVLERLNIKNFKLARYALKEGVATEFLNRVSY